MVAAEAGFPAARVGLADTGIVADAASRVAVVEPRIIPSGHGRAFLAPMPLNLLPISDELRATLHALGLRRIGEVAARGRNELETRFGPEGTRAHRWACGQDEDGFFRPVTSEELPEASFELEGPHTSLEPLLFVLRHLLARVCGDLVGEGRCAARLVLELELEDGSRRSTTITPARPTAREALLFDLCRAALEREFEVDRLAAPVTTLTLRVRERASAEARQGDLFVREPRDPLKASAALVRLHARLGDEAVVRPAPRRDHRPEARNEWTPVEARRASGDAGSSRAASRDDVDAVRAVLRLLPRPLPVRVRSVEGRPVEVWDEQGHHEVTAAEGPERLSGEWWKAPYRREYYRVCTSEGELLWLFREGTAAGSASMGSMSMESGEVESGEPAGSDWRLHGWWD
jgi:protein ImuB